MIRHTLSPSRPCLPIVMVLRTDDLDVLHHAAVFVAKNVAVQHKLADAVGLPSPLCEP